MNLLVHFVIYGHSWCFESSQIALAYGSCNFENFQNITRAHKSRNALAFIRFPILTNPKVWISQQVVHDIWGISWNRGLRNKPIHARISFFSDETHLWDTLTSLKCFFFMLYTHEFKGISCCRPWPAREKQHLVLQLVANEQDSCAILNLSIRVVGWIDGFLDTRFLLWHHHEDVIQLIHIH